jgi:endonuclease/exonuclease/phosphatase family metal-dependent hydrolase
LVKSGCLVAALISVGCRSGVALDFRDPRGPRYAASGVRQGIAPKPSLRIVTYNVKFAREIEFASLALRVDPDLVEADVIILEEMDLTGTERLACALGYGFVYYPAALHPGTGRPLRPFGVGILSPWPIVADWKVPLTTLSKSDKADKAGIAALLSVRGAPLVVVGVHLQSGLSASNVNRQLTELMEGVKARAVEGDVPMVVLGDFNTFTKDRVAAAGRALTGYGLRPLVAPGTATFTVVGITWPIQLDHIFVSAGIVGTAARGRRRGSDHYPLRADISWPGSVEEHPVRQRDMPLLCPVPHDRQ